MQWKREGIRGVGRAQGASVGVFAGLCWINRVICHHEEVRIEGRLGGEGVSQVDTWGKSRTGGLAGPKSQRQGGV